MVKWHHTKEGGEKVKEIFVLSMLLMAGIDDLRRGKISNYIVLPAILMSLIYRAYIFGVPYAFRGIGDMFVVCLVFLPAFRLRGIGAGDIKLFCMFTGFYSISFGLRVAALTILFAGVIALCRVWKYPDLLGRFSELKNYLLYGTGSEKKYFSVDESKEIEIIHMAPFAAISYFLLLVI